MPRPNNNESFLYYIFPHIRIINKTRSKGKKFREIFFEKVLKDKVPVQQTGTYSEATKKEVRDAVKELNPDMSGLDRG